MKLKIIFIPLLSIVSINTILAQDSAKIVLEKIQEKFNTINDLTANISQSVNGTVNLNGMVYYKKENKLRFEFKNILLLSDGVTAWSYNQKDNKVVISDYESEGNKILSIRQIIFEYPEDCEMLTYKSNNQTVLDLIPTYDTFSFKSIKLFLNEEYLITQALIDDPAAGEIEINISDYKLNNNLPETLFIFTPPEGIQVIDLR
jgi:outer membrane lipoprotein-sorting protein